MAYVVPSGTLIVLGLLPQGGIPKKPWEWLFTTVPGATGFFTILIMIFMYTTAVESVRRPMFEGFWFTHHLFIAFYVLMSVHRLLQYLGNPNFGCGLLVLLFYI